MMQEDISRFLAGTAVQLVDLWADLEEESDELPTDLEWGRHFDSLSARHPMGRARRDLVAPEVILALARRDR